MFITRHLSLALLISFLWHLFLINLSIIFLPIELKRSQYSAVNFFGSILRDVVSLTPSPGATKHFTEFPREAEIKKRSLITQTSFTSFPIEKETLDFDSIADIDRPVKNASFAASLNQTVAGVREHNIIYQPAYPKFPEVGTQQKLQARSVIFKIRVLACGLIQQVINIKSCGNPELDAALARYVRKWRYAPSLEQKGQWQTVKVNLEFE